MFAKDICGQKKRPVEIRKLCILVISAVLHPFCPWTNSKSNEVIPCIWLQLLNFYALFQDYSGKTLVPISDIAALQSLPQCCWSCSPSNEFQWHSRSKKKSSTLDNCGYLRCHGLITTLWGSAAGQSTLCVAQSFRVSQFLQEFCPYSKRLKSLSKDLKHQQPELLR